jgi:hypothetical protein
MSTTALAMAGLLSGIVSVQASVSTWLVFDPSAENRLVIDLPADLGGSTGTRLVGGVLATLHFDALSVILNQPLAVDVTIDEVRVAGESFAALPSLPELTTGTICVTADPDTPGTGTVTVPLLGLPQIAADMNTVTVLTSPVVGPLFPDGIVLAAHIEDELALDLRPLLRNRFTAGPVAVETEAAGTIPADVALLGGQPFRLAVTILNSLQRPEDPLLDECDAFLGAS